MTTLHTTRFGQIEVPDDRIIEMPEGILGFAQERRFVLLEHDSEGTPFKWLQAADNPNLAFIVMDPHLVVADYQVEFDKEAQRILGPQPDRADLAVMAIVNIPHDRPIEMTVNLRAPVVVHCEKRLGCQLVLPNEDYPIRHRLFPDPAGEGAGAAQAPKP